MDPGMPDSIAIFFREPSVRTCSFLVKTKPRSDTPLFLFQLAQELQQPLQFGLNYINLRETKRQLLRRYPVLAKHVGPEVPRGTWSGLRPVRDVSRRRLRALLAWVVAGREGEEGFSRFAPEDVWDEEVELPQGHHRAPEIGMWEPVPRVPEAAQAKAVDPILPELEGLYDFVERCLRAPVLIVIDSVDALAAHYGLEARKIVDALRFDLVEPGQANLIVVSESPADSAMESIVDGLLRLVPAKNPRRLEWRLTIERLPETQPLPRKYILRLLNGRLCATQTDDEVVDMLFGLEPSLTPGIPKELLASLQGTRVDP